MGLFSKNPCVFCGKEVGFIKGKKIKNGDYICDDCEKRCSAFIEVSRYDKDFLEVHMEYMNKQELLYKVEVESLDRKKDIKSIMRDYNGIRFIDSIGMFEVVTPKYSKKVGRELFRYDQIKDFKYYTVDNLPSEKTKYAESGIEIELKCHYDEHGMVSNDTLSGKTHPYVATIRIPFAKNTDSYEEDSLAKAHLNELFGRASESLVGGIKEKFTGTGKERASLKSQAELAGALGGLAKGFFKKDGAAMDAAKENVKEKTVAAVNVMCDYGSKYTEVADSAEKRAWENR